MSSSSSSVPSVASVSIPTRTVALDESVQVATENHLSASSLSLSQVQIALDSSEQTLFETLVAATNAYNAGQITLPNGNNSSGAEPLVFRVAGGWVRDKLLQLQTHDVDIAVNTLTGHEAALLVQGYLRRQHKSPGRIGVIAANPDQSKHLETATMRIGGMDVDFCNLRGSEVYHDKSRIPTSTFGNPLEDATRRDFTLNALFYNLTSQKVEDWTGRGLNDLRQGRLVTPMDPAATFTDDPLRVLRAIRFAVRYRFSLDPAMEDAAKRLDIHQALHVKVSRERVGKELEAMLWSGKGANPVRALQIISRLQLAGSVFVLPIAGQGKVTSMHGYIGDTEYHDTYQEYHDTVQARHVREVGWQLSRKMLDIFVRVLQSFEEQQHQPGTTSYDERLSAVAAFLLPFRKLTYKEAPKMQDYLAVTYVFREGVKFKTNDVQAITRLMETIDDTTSFLTQAATGTQVNRLDAGLFLRSTKKLWVTSLMLATVLKLEKSSQSDPQVDWVQVMLQVYHSIVQMNLDECWNMKPFFDGKALIQTLKLSQGPVVGTCKEEQLRWMLLNPKGSQQDCEVHLQSFKRKLEQGSDHESTTLGKSDGTSPSCALDGTGTARHFSKKMHVESMEMMDDAASPDEDTGIARFSRVESTDMEDADARPSEKGTARYSRVESTEMEDADSRSCKSGGDVPRFSRVESTEMKDVD